MPTSQPTYDYSRSDMILSIGLKLISLFSVYFLLASDLPASTFPANKVRSWVASSPKP